MFLLPHGGVLVGGQQTVAGLHAGHGQWPLGTRLTRDKDRLLVRLLLLLWQRRHGNLLAEARQKKETDSQKHQDGSQSRFSEKWHWCALNSRLKTHAMHIYQ